MSEANLVDKQLIKKLILKHGNLDHDYNATDYRFGLKFNSKTKNSLRDGRADFIIWDQEQKEKDYIIIAECKQGFHNLDKALRRSKTICQR